MQDRPNTQREGMAEPERTGGLFSDRPLGESAVPADDVGRGPGGVGESGPTRPLGEETRRQTEQLGREVREQARELGEELEEAAVSRAEQGRHRVAEGLHAVSEALRSGARQLREEDEQVGRDLVERLADPVERISDYLERHETRELAADLEDFARRNQALFLGGAFAAGLLGARFLKSSTRTDAYDYEPTRRRLPSHQTRPTGEGPLSGDIDGRARRRS